MERWWSLCCLSRSIYSQITFEQNVSNTEMKGFLIKLLFLWKQKSLKWCLARVNQAHVSLQVRYDLKILLICLCVVHYRTGSCWIFFVGKKNKRQRLLRKGTSNNIIDNWLVILNISQYPSISGTNNNWKQFKATALNCFFFGFLCYYSAQKKRVKITFCFSCTLLLFLNKLCPQSPTSERFCLLFLLLLLFGWLVVQNFALFFLFVELYWEELLLWPLINLSPGAFNC